MLLVTSLVVLSLLLLSKTACIAQEVVGRGGRGGAVVLASVVGCWRRRHLPYLAQIGRGLVIGVVGSGAVVAVGVVVTLDEVVFAVVGVVVTAVGVVVGFCLRRVKYCASSGSVTGACGEHTDASCCWVKE